jgi:hypothetical protein
VKQKTPHPRSPSYPWALCFLDRLAFYTQIPSCFYLLTNFLSSPSPTLCVNVGNGIYGSGCFFISSSFPHLALSPAFFIYHLLLLSYPENSLFFSLLFSSFCILIRAWIRLTGVVGIAVL